MKKLLLLAVLVGLVACSSGGFAECTKRCERYWKAQIKKDPTVEAWEFDELMGFWINQCRLECDRDPDAYK